MENEDQPEVEFPNTMFFFFGRIAMFLYNPENNAMFGIRLQIWARIITFYIVFSVSYQIIMPTVRLHHGWMKIDPNDYDHLIDLDLSGKNLSLEFRPLPPVVDFDGTTIWVQTDNFSRNEYWVYSLDKYLKPYKYPSLKMIECDYSVKKDQYQLCVFNTSLFGECGREHMYGYNSAEPCVFLNLNKVYGWRPLFYKASADLPEDVPDDLRRYVSEVEETFPERMKTVWLSCEGVDLYDQANIVSVKYFPQPGFPGYYFPYLKQNDYLSPLVAVRFTILEKQMETYVVCKAWAKNIETSIMYGRGSVVFILEID